MDNRENTKEQLQEDLRKTREELAIQKWGLEKTLGGMKSLVKEFMQKSKELEKMNRLMVGRELKMVELKKEIKELRAKKYD